MDFWTASESLIIDRNEVKVIEPVLDERRSTYRRILSQFGGNGVRVVDKFPGNLNVVGTIYRAYPNAHILYLSRNPVDIAVSLWATYSSPCSPLTTTRQAIVDAIRQSAIQADYWRQTLPADRFMKVVYEDLVADPETWIRRILEFCSLSWEDACLRASESQRTVKTPSIGQVRQPVYTTSINRWKRYEPWLGEFESLGLDR
jgi:hypothetical protein